MFWTVSVLFLHWEIHIQTYFSLSDVALRNLYSDVRNSDIFMCVHVCVHVHVHVRHAFVQLLATVLHAAPSSLISNQASSVILLPASKQREYCFCRHTMPFKSPLFEKKKKKCTRAHSRSLPKAIWRGYSIRKRIGVFSFVAQVRLRPANTVHCSMHAVATAPNQTVVWQSHSQQSPVSKTSLP